MRTFELIDEEAPNARPCAVLACDQSRGVFTATVEPWAGPNDVPVQFSPFVARGERDIPPRWVMAWVEERIAPSSRQNIGSIMRAHDLSEYDACELLVSGEGRSTQDGFYLRETTAGFRHAALLGKELRLARNMVGLTQGQLAQKSRVPQESISRLERGQSNPTLGTLEKVAVALGFRLKINLERQQ